MTTLLHQYFSIKSKNISTILITY